MLDEIAPPERPMFPDGREGLEWPTLALVIGLYLGWIVLVFTHDIIPLWLWFPLATWVSAWWGSAQHEMLHGHPTRSRAINTAMATPPIWLWLPFESYRQSHMTHHRDERLTDPLDDPESRYFTAQGWCELGPIGQKLVALQSTLLGRLIIGPLWCIGVFWRAAFHKLRAGDSETCRIWLWHGLWCAILLYVALGLGGIPLWQYVLGFVYCGTALALVRSFAEHKARDSIEQRTAIVENSPILGLLFLNNNLHVVHHRWPGVAWYQLPGLYRTHRNEVLASNDGLVYNGYLEVFRRFFVRSYDQPVHPSDRAPLRDGSQPGNG